MITINLKPNNLYKCQIGFEAQVSYLLQCLPLSIIFLVSFQPAKLTNQLITASCVGLKEAMNFNSVLPQHPKVTHLGCCVNTKQRLVTQTVSLDRFLSRFTWSLSFGKPPMHQNLSCIHTLKTHISVGQFTFISMQFVSSLNSTSLQNCKYKVKHTTEGPIKRKQSKARMKSSLSMPKSPL